MTYLLAKLTEWGLSALSWIVLQIQKYWMQILVVVGIVALVATISLYFRKKPKLDQKQIVEAQQAIAEQDRAKMVEILAISDAKEAEADGYVANSKVETVNAIQESKKKWNELSNDELAKELERRANQ